MKELFEMECHEEIEIKTSKNKYIILRVPGGWLYRQLGSESVFVPYNNEFEPTPPREEVWER